jgi:hypothetical protein
MHIRKHVSVVVAALIAATLGIGTTTWTHASGISPEPPASDGTGESLLLVVADVVSPSAAGARLEQINEPFGDLQGFYADTTDGYDVIGALIQTSPDTVAVACPPFLDVFESVVGTQLVDLDCPSGRSVNVLEPLQTTYISVADLPNFQLQTACGGAGSPPCQLAALTRLLGDDLQLDRGLSLIGTAFRTKHGAEEFLEFARAAGVTNLVTLQVKKNLVSDIGLGQEPNPDGSGPLTGQLSGQEDYQR